MMETRSRFETRQVLHFDANRLAELESNVAKIVRDHLSGTPVDKVTVVPGMDHDGDNVLRVSVIVDMKPPNAPDPGKIGSMIWHLRSGLPAEYDDFFPIVVYTDRREAHKIRP